jgi:hypothetical protein
MISFLIIWTESILLMDSSFDTSLCFASFIQVTTLSIYSDIVDSDNMPRFKTGQWIEYSPIDSMYMRSIH